MKKKILVVGRQVHSAYSFYKHITALDYKVILSYGCNDGYLRAQEGGWDAIILETDLPDSNGLELCQRLRQGGDITPVLFLASDHSDSLMVSCFEQGGDEYIRYPINITEFEIRLKALIRRAQLHDDTAEDYVTCGAVTLDHRQRRVLLKDKECHLSATEFELLHYLMRNAGQVFSRRHLLNAIWGHGSGHTVNSHVNRIRKKLEQDPSEPELIKTVWGVGYKVDCPNSLGC